MRVLSFATAKQFLTKQYANNSWDWRTIVQEFITPHRVMKTRDQIAKLDKKSKVDKAIYDEIKKVNGAFIGGHLAGGIRSSKTTEYRDIICWDADNVKGDKEEFFNDVNAVIGEFDHVVHSTFSHTEARGKYHIILPLSRSIKTQEEYKLVHDNVAKRIGVRYFDMVCHDIVRMMFNPVVASDEENYEFYDNKKNRFLIVNNFLEDKKNDHPTATQTIYTTEILPSQMGGIKGAFCKAYNIADAIETYLPDVYIKEGYRWRYAESTSPAGMFLVENSKGEKCISNHATDPLQNTIRADGTSVKAFNSYDLVRLTLFGKGKGSFNEMDNLVKNDPKSGLIAYASKELVPPEVEKIKSHLAVTRMGGIKKSQSNVFYILENDLNFKDLFVYNEFLKEDCLKRSLALFSDNDADMHTYPAKVSDRNVVFINSYMEKYYDIGNKEAVWDEIRVLSNRDRVHPVREFITAEEWDGVPRIENLGKKYLGVEDTELARACFKVTLIGAVARVFSPGCKFDSVLILTGAQGVGKSLFINKLASPWFSDTPISFNDIKRTTEDLTGSWIVELSELDTFRKTDIAARKRFITSQEDTYRMPYDRLSSTFPRQFILIGTSNESDFLNDPSGERRFMPFIVDAKKREKDIADDDALNEKERKQIFAEAFFFWKKEGLKGTVLLEKYWEKMKKQREKFEDLPPNIDDIREGLDIKLPEREIWDKLLPYQKHMYINKETVHYKNHDNEDIEVPEGTRYREAVTTTEVNTEILGGDKYKITSVDGRVIVKCLRALDWIESHYGSIRIKGYDNKRAKVYVRKKD